MSGHTCKLIFSQGYNSDLKKKRFYLKNLLAYLKFNNTIRYNNSLGLKIYLIF